jgi:nitrogen regulatory protein PII
MILMYADAHRLDAVRADLRELGAPGYTVLPVEEGAGRTGVHSGDRVHPGALVLVTVIAEDAPAEAMFDELVRRRDTVGDHMSRLFLMPVERSA